MFPEQLLIIPRKAFLFLRKDGNNTHNLKIRGTGKQWISGAEPLLFSREQTCCNISMIWHGSFSRFEDDERAILEFDGVL